MTLEERRDYLDGFDRLAGQLSAPERRATPAEIEAVDVLRIAARRAMVAEVFRHVEPAVALPRHPELAWAYGVLKAVGDKAVVERLTGLQATALLRQARERLAAGIERGEMPSTPSRVATPTERFRDIDR